MGGVLSAEMEGISMKQWMQRCAACLVAILCAVFVPGRALALETPAEARSGVVRVIVEMQTDLYSLETGEPDGDAARL